MNRPIKHRPKRRVSKSRTTHLDALVAEAVVDCYGESEQITGLYTMMDSHLAVPFKTVVLGVPVTVERVDLNQREEIVAVCRRARIRQTVPILDLPLPSPPPAGVEWIDAYRHWLRGAYSKGSEAYGSARSSVPPDRASTPPRA
jgi:hypothetical protein